MKETDESNDRRSGYPLTDRPKQTNKTKTSARSSSSNQPPCAQNVLLRRNVNPQVMPAGERCQVTMTYFGPELNVEYDREWFEPDGDEITIMQQHCGGENLVVFKGFLKPDDQFAFESPRHTDFPFALACYINGVIYNRLSICCESRCNGFMRIGGRYGFFGITDVQNAKPCRRCRYEQRMTKLLEDEGISSTNTGKRLRGRSTKASRLRSQSPTARSNSSKSTKMGTKTPDSVISREETSRSPTDRPSDSRITAAPAPSSETKKSDTTSSKHGSGLKTNPETVSSPEPIEMRTSSPESDNVRAAKLNTTPAPVSSSKPTESDRSSPDPTSKTQSASTHTRKKQLVPLGAKASETTSAGASNSETSRSDTSSPEPIISHKSTPTRVLNSKPNKSKTSSSSLTTSRKFGFETPADIVSSHDSFESDTSSQGRSTALKASSQSTSASKPNATTTHTGSSDLKSASSHIPNSGAIRTRLSSPQPIESDDSSSERDIARNENSHNTSAHILNTNLNTQPVPSYKPNSMTTAPSVITPIGIKSDESSSEDGRGSSVQQKLSDSSNSQKKSRLRNSARADNERSDISSTNTSDIQRNRTNKPDHSRLVSNRRTANEMEVTTTDGSDDDLKKQPSKIHH